MPFAQFTVLHLYSCIYCRFLPQLPATRYIRFNLSIKNLNYTICLYYHTFCAFIEFSSFFTSMSGNLDMNIKSKIMQK